MTPPRPPPLPHSRRTIPAQPLSFGKRSETYRSASQPTRYHQAARAAWVAPIIAVLLGQFIGAGQQGILSGAAIAVATVLVLLLGLTFGIIALVGVRKVGRRGVLIPAVVGIAINGLILLCLSALFLSSMRSAHGHAAATTPVGSNISTISQITI
jgi:hypothetical protein